MVDTTIEPAIRILKMEYSPYFAVFTIIYLAVSQYYAIFRIIFKKYKLPSPPFFLYFSLIGRTFGKLS